MINKQISDRIEQLKLSTNMLGFDAWGLNLEDCKTYYSMAHWIFSYFRTQVMGAENIPKGRVLVVANHSGQLPFDGLVISVASLLYADSPRLLRPLAERWFPRLPFINEIFSRAGVVLGDPINCRNLLQDDQAVFVTPEGAKGCGKLWPQRYQLVPFGHGFMRLALETRTPILPVALIGAEEALTSIYNLKPLARLFHAPYFPIPPLLPILGPMAYVPLPTQFHVHFGELLHFEGTSDADDEVIEGQVKIVMNKIQDMLHFGCAQRKGIF